MTGQVEDNVAFQALRMALRHPACTDGRVLAPADGQSRLELDLRVEMPIHFKPDGISSSGVRLIEPVAVTLPVSYPWQSPRFALREDFPRHFPHLMPYSATPRPCLVDGDQDEFFLQFGLVESGLFHLVEQLASWLSKAATSDLINPVQGWEPMLRRDFRDAIELDAAAARAAVDKKGGWQVWKGQHFRRGPDDGALSGSVEAWVQTRGEVTPLIRKPADGSFTFRRLNEDIATGNTVVAIIWPDKGADGRPFVSATYLPECVATLADLRTRAAELGCRRGLDGFIANLERSFQGMSLPRSIPVGVVLCARRPVHLIGTTSNIELLPYLIEIRADDARSTLFPQGEAQPVSPATHYQSLSRSLLASLSGTPERSGLSLLGCGSLGSKLAMHAARSGQAVTAVSDQGALRPHNMARHALGSSHVASNKADALAKELDGFGLAPAVFKDDLSVGLRDHAGRAVILPPSAEIGVNTTASLAVREALTAVAGPKLKHRLFEVALFGHGRGVLILADGRRHNPSHADLMADLYATIDGTPEAELLFGSGEGLSTVQIGQGCGSLTMTMSDARLSLMAAAAFLQLNRLIDAPTDGGRILLGTRDDATGMLNWRNSEVSAFETVPIQGSEGWELRLSPRVANRMRAEAARYTTVETGGVMIGCASARLKSVTVVDLLDPPSDSRRSADLFVLGTDGLQAMIQNRHQRSGHTLFDVGTWHSHLHDTGPSATDWRTAADLAAERAPPSVLLIATPKRLHALIAQQKAS